MARVNVFLSDELLDEINRQAKEEGIKRSALVQAAVEKYIEAQRRYISPQRPKPGRCA